MSYKLHKNAVITGSLNSFCLACETFLKAEHQAYEHIETMTHQRKMTQFTYLDKFKDEQIRKFTGGYYCELCNVLLPIASKMTFHITEKEHKFNKANLLLKQKGDDVIAFNNILIEEKAWHTLIDGICSICNAEFDDESDHKSDKSHSLNLVLKPVKFGEDNSIYRHLDESAVQCLTCNKLLAPGRMTEHFNDPKHHEHYAKRRIETNEVSNGIKTNGTVVEKEKKVIEAKKDQEEFKKNNKKTSAEEKSKILESVTIFQIKGININLESETAFCKKCSNVVPFEFSKIETHIESHTSAKKIDSELQYPSNLDQNLNRVNINDKWTKKSDDAKGNAANKNTKVSPPTSDSEIQDEDVFEFCGSTSEYSANNNKQTEARTFAKENQLTYNEGNSQSYCRICEVKLPSSLKSMKEHVAGANHKKLTETFKPNLIKPVPPMAKQEIRFYLQSSFDVEGLFTQESVINEEYCIPRNSYWLISTNNSRLRCLICEMNLSPHSDVKEHVRTTQHSLKHSTINVIISEKSEFIREVRPGLFHCGYCNVAVPSWSEMQLHLKCSEHKEKRAAGERRLRILLPDLQEYKMRRNLEAMRMMWLLNRFC